MKAKDYYELVKDFVWDRQDVYRYLMALNTDTKKLIQQRNVKRNDALAAVIREINQKHNAVMAMFRKAGKEQPLIDDMFIGHWLDEIPGLSKYFPGITPASKRTDNAASVGEELGLTTEETFNTLAGNPPPNKRWKLWWEDGTYDINVAPTIQTMLKIFGRSPNPGEVEDLISYQELTNADCVYFEGCLCKRLYPGGRLDPVECTGAGVCKNFIENSD